MHVQGKGQSLDIGGPKLRHDNINSNIIIHKVGNSRVRFIRTTKINSKILRKRK